MREIVLLIVMSVVLTLFVSLTLTASDEHDALANEMITELEELKKNIPNLSQVEVIEKINVLKKKHITQWDTISKQSNKEFKQLRQSHYALWQELVMRDRNDRRKDFETIRALTFQKVFALKQGAKRVESIIRRDLKEAKDNKSRLQEHFGIEEIDDVDNVNYTQYKKIITAMMTKTRQDLLSELDMLRPKLLELKGFSEQLNELDVLKKVIQEAEPNIKATQQVAAVKYHEVLKVLPIKSSMELVAHIDMYHDYLSKSEELEVLITTVDSLKQEVVDSTKS